MHFDLFAKHGNRIFEIPASYFIISGIIFEIMFEESESIFLQWNLHSNFLCVELSYLWSYLYQKSLREIMQGTIMDVVIN